MHIIWIYKCVRIMWVVLFCFVAAGATYPPGCPTSGSSGSTGPVGSLGYIGPVGSPGSTPVVTPEPKTPKPSPRSALCVTTTPASTTDPNSTPTFFDCQENEEWSSCPSPCLRENCEDAFKQPVACFTPINDCQPKCVCKPGFYRDTTTGNCVTADKCPQYQCGANETFVQCAVNCPTEFCPTNEYYSFIACSVAYPCPPGCACSSNNFRRRSYEDRTCIPIEECPPVACSGLNEVWDVCPSICLSENCEDAGKPIEPCVEETNCQPQCVCDDGHYRNGSNVCVPASECTQVQCGANETFVPCQIDCPTNFCPTDEYDYLIACSPPNPCPSGCACSLSNSRRRSTEDRICIPIEECPPVTCSGINEVWNVCPSSCLAENCEDLHKPNESCSEETRYCRPRCVCADGYYRNASNVCIPAAECLSECDASANLTEVSCTFKCPYQFCPDSDYQEQYACKPPRDCPPGCGCKLGYRYKSYDDLTCILAEDCPAQPCTSQPNEIWNPCPSCLAESCADADNPKTGVCNELVHNCNPQCICKEYFYRNESKICVPKSECPKCGPNERYVQCKAGCPTDYCPVDDNQFLIACDPPYPCTGGCICKLNYKLRSTEDPTCIPIQECPPVNCTRPNEVWSPCTSPCYSESCQTGGAQKDCDYIVDYCEARCICAPDHLRNDEWTCVPKDQCPPSLEYPQPLPETSDSTSETSSSSTVSK